MNKRWGNINLFNLRSQRRHARRSGGLGLRISIVLFAGMLLGGLSMITVAALYKNTLRTRIETTAQALGTQHIAAIRDSVTGDNVSSNGDSMEDTDYAFVEDKLARIKQVNADARFFYLMARNSAGEVYFLSDSEPEDSKDNSPLGEPYPEASAELRAMFDNGRTVIEGPLRDSYGVWLSALAPVIDDETHRMIAVVGMDVPATSYATMLGLAGGVPVLLAILAAGVIYARYQSSRRYQENLQFRAEMISIASHELRTPLSGLRWSQEELLRQKAGNDQQRHILEIMYDSTRRLQESIEGVLQLASLESGKEQRLLLKDIDIRVIIEDTIAVQRLAASRRNITVTLTANWPEQVIVHADAQRLKRVFHNLISNAVKYNKDNAPVTIDYSYSSTRVKDSKDLSNLSKDLNGGSKDGAHGGSEQRESRREHEGIGGEHVISIQDHGIGIPKSEQARVWEGFYRATNTDNHDVQGTGMGLFLARNIIEQHHGRIWLESEEGKGTTVFVALPVAELVTEEESKNNNEEEKDTHLILTKG